jgi:hypothetical protein
MIVEYPTLSSNQQKLIFLDKPLMELYQHYSEAREKRDAERESFRATKDVEAVGTALEQVLGLVGKDPPEENPEGKED